MNATKKVVSNSFYLFLMWFFSTLFGYLFWVALANFLPKADVGIFSATLNLALFIFGFSFLGLTAAETKLLPQYAAKKQHGKIGGTVNYVTKTVLAVNAAAALAIFALAPQISAFYLNETALRVLAVFLLVLSAATVLANHLYSMQKMKLFFLSESAAAFGKLLLAAALIFLGFGWLGAAGGVAFSYLAVSLLRLKWIPLSGKADRREIWNYAMPAFIGGLGTILVNQGSIVFLSFLSSAAAVGAFTIAFIFTTPIKIIPQIISQAIFPISSEEFETNQLARLKNLVAQSMRYSYLISLPLALAFVFYAREFLVLFAKSYSSDAFTFQLLAIAYLFFGLGSIMTGVLYFAGKPKLNRDISLFSGIVNVGLIFALAPFLGITGAAVAFLVSGGLLFFAGLWHARKHIGMRTGVGSIAKIAAASAVFVAVLIIFGTAGFSGTAKTIWIAISLLSASAAYLASLLLLRFFGGVDIRVIGAFEHRIPKRLKPFVALILKLIRKYSNKE